MTKTEIQIDEGWTVIVQAEPRYVTTDWHRTGSVDPTPSRLHPEEARQLAEALLTYAEDADPARWQERGMSNG